MHEGKQHGLNDCVDFLLDKKPNLVIIPDAGTNDVDECRRLTEAAAKVIILDHHDKEIDNPYAIVINNQIGDYPNKDFSGVGVTWQFCRYIDKLLGINYADFFIDLVALGNIADMMSLRSLETKHIIQKGLQDPHNPFIVYLADKNDYSLKGKLTPIGVAFYIAPFVNAIVRSGTLEEKQLVFESMLSFHAFDIIPSTKRGHALGAIEKVVEQAMRVVTNVKARQTKAQTEGMDKLEKLIQENDMMKHQVLLFLLESGEIDRNIAGLSANKIMAKYQRPVCILTRTPEGYQGSARGCDQVDVNDFKGICNETNVVEYTIGHPGAFGLGIKSENIDAFVQKTDEILKDMPNEPVYYVDYIYNGTDINQEDLISMASLENLWGKDVSEALIAIKGLKVTPDMVTVYDKRTVTIKIGLPNGISIMLFNAKEKDIEKLQENNTGFIEVDIVGTPQVNEWMGNVSGQVFIEEYQIVDSNKFFF